MKNTINIDKYRLQDIEFHGNKWEFIYSLMYLKYQNKINILEIGNGNYSLLFGITSELKDRTKKILSIDVLNKFKQGEKEFYEKKRIFSALSERNDGFVEHFQGDAFANDILKVARKLFLEDEIGLFVIEYMVNDEYMDSIFDTYDFYFSENIDIYYHNLKKSEHSIKYFEKISNGKKKVILDNGNGTGIIKI